jgi:hypothetical protein
MAILRDHRVDVVVAAEVEEEDKDRSRQLKYLLRIQSESRRTMAGSLIQELFAI